MSGTTNNSGMLDGLDQSVLSALRWLWSTDPLENPAVEARARDLLFDTIGCAIAGLSTPEVRAFAAELAAGEPGHLYLPGFPSPLSTSGYLYAFSAAACCFEGPEGLALAEGRPGLHAVPAVLAHARASTTMREVLQALVTGFEIGGRMGATYRIRRGMHVDGTWGTFGAVAAIARLRGLSPEQTLEALAHAACQMPASLYFPITMGSSARNTYVGHGVGLAAASVSAALTGFGGPPGSLREHISMVLGYEAQALDARVRNGEWLILRGYLKNFPIVKHVHYGICAGISFHEAHGADTSDITRVVLKVYRNAMTYCGVRNPQTAIQAQFSLTYGLAWALCNGGLSIAAFSPDGLNDPAVRRLERMIEVVEDEALTKADKRGATLEVTAGGRTSVFSVDQVPGDPELPLTRKQLEEKFMAGAVAVMGAEKANRLAVAVLDAARDGLFRLQSADVLS